MNQQITERFIAALRKLEESREVEEIAALYAENAEITNVVAPHKFSGQQGVRDFWTKYRASFGEMRSEFRNKIIGEQSAALEWTTIGNSSENHEIAYSGVTILEFEGDKITRSCAYFNSQDLGKQLESGESPKQNQAVSG